MRRLLERRERRRRLRGSPQLEVRGVVRARLVLDLDRPKADEQLVDEVACLAPDVLDRIDSTPGVTLETEALPYVQKPAAQALMNAALAYAKTVNVTSALRMLPQQYMLHRWAASGRCGVTLAAPVGESNHEQGLAVDISMSGGGATNRAIRAAMAANGFKWLGAEDPVHFDYTGEGQDLQGLSVRAFQRLWNRNHPEATLEVNGVYDAKVEGKLKISPAGGFDVGARCDP